MSLVHPARSPLAMGRVMSTPCIHRPPWARQQWLECSVAGDPGRSASRGAHQGGWVEASNGLTVARQGVWCGMPIDGIDAPRCGPSRSRQWMNDGWAVLRRRPSFSGCCRPRRLAPTRDEEIWGAAGEQSVYARSGLLVRRGFGKYRHRPARQLPSRSPRYGPPDGPPLTVWMPLN